MRVVGVSVASAFTFDGLTTDGGRNGGKEQAPRLKSSGNSTTRRHRSAWKEEVEEWNI
jgi:hypothetical protein